MPRSVWKGSFIDPFLKKILTKNKKDAPKALMNKKIWSRRSTILPEFVGSTVLVHNGVIFARCNITEEKVGHKFGEFVETRLKKYCSRDPEKKKKYKNKVHGPIQKKVKGKSGQKPSHKSKEGGTTQSRKMSTGVTDGLTAATIRENNPHIAFQTSSMKHGCVYGIQLDIRHGMRF